MNSFIIDYDPFSMESVINILKDGRRERASVTSNLEDLVKSVVTLSYQYDIYSVKVNAPSVTTNEIKRQVSALESTTYSKNKIRVEEF